MGDMSAAGTAPTVEGGASLLPTTFTSLIDFGHAVDKLALSQNKNVSVDPKASGSRGRVYRCKHWIAARKKHTMTVDKKTCKCLEYDEMMFPCKCAIALAIKLGRPPNLFVRDNAHESYSIRDAELTGIAKTLNVVLAPSGKELLDRARNPAAAAVVEEVVGKPHSLANVGLDEEAASAIKAPPKRTEESHGNSRRKRKSSGKGQSRGKAASTGRTSTRTFTAANARSAAAVQEARQTCKKCRSEGRTDIEPHKSSICPYDSTVPDIEVIMLSDDE
eukprot:m.404858 g.404858  ORF g.404858 m.404858 type:complete len:276 (-) comp16794_c3_seq13:137-964(-)